jgi:hypothetical protein
VTEEERRREIRAIKALLEELHQGARRQIEEMEQLRRQVAQLENGLQPAQPVRNADEAAGQHGTFVDEGA